MSLDLFTLLHPALAAASTPAIPAGRLVPAALLGIAVIVLLITRFKLHPFLGLTIGSLVVGAVAGVKLSTTVNSFSTGFGATAASVGTLIALGAMFGKLLADSGGADEI
ncbi:MAG TPA: gluconate transporter, partial [Pedococcus sp.]|nr:gluconate transporter [Pedococcus sp.]